MADLRRWAREMPSRARPKDLPLEEEKPKGLHPDEKRALFKLRREARQNGATLYTNGEGGLPPSLVLGVMRRDSFTCVECDGQQALQVHHKAGVVDSRKISKLGHINRPEGLEVVCHPCHDKLHEKARAKGIDSSQVLAEGDVGTKYDHGQPLAQPKK